MLFRHHLLVEQGGQVSGFQRRGQTDATVRGGPVRHGYGQKRAAAQTVRSGQTRCAAAAHEIGDAGPGSADRIRRAVPGLPLGRQFWPALGQHWAGVFVVRCSDGKDIFFQAQQSRQAQGLTAQAGLCAAPMPHTV